MNLFITGSTPRSIRAITQIKRLCDEHLRGCHDLKIIDIYQQPAMARKEQIIAAPTLIKKVPLPLRRIIGDLTDLRQVMAGLNLCSDLPTPSKPIR